MKLKHLVPWRVRNLADQWLEKSVRPQYPTVYKFLKFGRRNINTPEYWDRVWSTDTIPRDYEGMFNAILDLVPAGVKVLDVGCGVGNLARLMRDRRNAHVTCLDFSPWACGQLEKEGFETVTSALPRIPMPDDSFDVAVATEVLEHLDEPEETIRQMVRVVRDRGIVICSVPNDTMHSHEELEHQESFDTERLTQLLAGFSSEIEVRVGRYFNESGPEFLMGYAVISK